MPLLTPDRPTRDQLLGLAAARWDALADARPELRPAVDLQRQLLGIVLNATETLEGAKLPRLSLPPKYLCAKLGRGVPFLAGEPIPIPVSVLRKTLLALCEALSTGAATEAADHIREALASGRVDAASLLTASLSRDQEAVRTGAAHQGLAPDLTWLVGELASGPFAHVLQRALLASPDESLASAAHDWSAGYCLLCGSWPALAEVVHGRRALRCSFCALAWELQAYHCIYCGEEGEPFVTAAPVEERKDRRLELCAQCGAYLKTVDVDALSPFPLVAIADMETMDLDIAAMEHGYGRPPLKDFAVKR
jgi:FdhE protein